MINLSRESLSISRFTSDGREWKWAFATTMFAMPFEFLRRLESDRVRGLVTLGCLIAVSVVYGLDRKDNISSPYWVFTLHQFGAAITFVFLVFSFLNIVQMNWRYPELTDRAKTTDNPTVSAILATLAYHLGFPFTMAAVGQAIEILLNTPAMNLNNCGIFLSSTILNCAIFLVAMFIVREHVIDWAKFIVYGTILYLAYAVVVVANPIPMNPGFLALWYVVAFCSYGMSRTVTKITIGYKNRSESPIFAAPANPGV